jgi:hypothetical protein
VVVMQAPSKILNARWLTTAPDPVHGLQIASHPDLAIDGLDVWTSQSPLTVGTVVMRGVLVEDMPVQYAVTSWRLLSLSEVALRSHAQ